MFEDVSVGGRLATVGLVVLAFAILSSPHPAFRECVPSHHAPIPSTCSEYSATLGPAAWLTSPFARLSFLLLSNDVAPLLACSSAPQASLCLCESQPRC